MYFNFLKHKKFTWEVIIADDASKDNTAKIVKGYQSKYPGFKLLTQPINLGKGGNVIAGMFKFGQMEFFDLAEGDAANNPVEVKF